MHYRSFWRWSSQPITWQVLAKPNLLWTSDNTIKRKQQLMKITKICKTKFGETKAWFRSPFMPSSQEMYRAYSTGLHGTSAFYNSIQLFTQTVAICLTTQSKYTAERCAHVIVTRRFIPFFFFFSYACHEP